jgi:hypothetical protein
MFKRMKIKIMVYQAVSGIAAGQLGLRLKLASSLSGL